MTSKIKAYDVNGIQINVGDPVMCVGDAYGLTVGKTYTVESISESGEFVRVVGDHGLLDGWGGSNFRIDKTDIRNDIPEAFADDLVTAKWKYGYSDEKRTELLRVARMEGAHAVAVADGVTYSGAVSEVSEVSLDHIIIGGAGLTLPLWQIGWNVTATAPKPADPTGGDTVVLAASPKTGVDCCLWSKAFTGKYSMELGGFKIAPYNEPGPWLRGDELEAVMLTLKAGDVVEVDCMGHTATGELWAHSPSGLSLWSSLVRTSDGNPSRYVDALRIIERAPEPDPGADIPDEVVAAAVEAATREWDSGRSVAYSDAMRAALAAADAKRAELEGQA